MTSEDLEFSISQYLDGTLADDARIALEARLAKDPQAQVMLAENQRLSELLRSAPVPSVQWDRLAESISLAIDEQSEERVARASWWFRARIPAGLAMAASILLVIGLTLQFLSGPSPVGTAKHATLTPRTQTAILIVQGPHSEEPAGVVVSQITIGAGGGYASDSSLSPYADEIDNRPSRVVIASGMNPDQPQLGFPN